ncbi:MULTISPECIES: hypothetical protein [Paenibacillus]|uniref:Cellobiose phosphorylase n=1 Tax=Paenibacillus albilobatus TaxID=2716884 RepID=A0A920CC03_9BACL|nr:MULTISPECIES: hypothetical protein [Paenibacillus]GIO31032.1 hypothetical protein J2TS6_21730 [Paenibacillus albilobatus]
MDAYYNCLNCMNRKVRILTIDRKVYEGKIVKVDRERVYLETSEGGPVRTSAFGPYRRYGFGYRNQILTLSLFTLLAIALI